MPWSTPTLRTVRGLVRDSVNASLPGADATVPNSVLRVVSDTQGALCHLTLQYIDWLALQLMPDTAETEWLDRHAQIWLVNADGSIGRKLATLSNGSVSMTALSVPTLVPQYTPVTGATGVAFETLADVLVATDPTTLAVRALDPGTVGNLVAGTPLTVDVPGITGTATVVELDHGTDDETDSQLRYRLLLRIRQPPMGGDATDYEQWALSIPGVTRAWSYPLEMGIGTVTVRFMMDDLRATNFGFPLPQDVDMVTDYLSTVRPVAVKDFFVEAPIPYPINVHMPWLDLDSAATRNAITDSLLTQFYNRSKPGQTWYRAWTDEAIINAPGVNAYGLDAADQPMANNGFMPMLGDITYG
jgi:uncharacterized phage protein gp47/JayE